MTRRLRPGETRTIVLAALIALMLLAVAATLPSNVSAQERPGASNRDDAQRSMGESDSSSSQFFQEGEENGPTDEQYAADEDPGPLSGGRAFGRDVLVEGDPLLDEDGEVMRDDSGNVIVGIDRVVIFSQGCELRGSEEDPVTITLRDQGDDGRLIDGVNVDIRIDDEDRIISDGRRTIFEENDNPNRVVRPFPVEESDDFEDNAPNDVFPIVSSTGIEDENCRVVGASRAPSEDPGGDPGDDNDLPSVGEDPEEGVIPGSGPDTPLPNTGGVSPVLLAAALVLALGGSGLAARLLLGARAK